MRKSMLLVRSNIRKAKGQTISITALILLAAMLLNIWLILLLDYNQNFARYHKDLNAEHAFFVFNNNDKKFQDYLNDTISQDARTDEYSIDNMQLFGGTMDYAGGSLSSDFLVVSKSDALDRDIGKYEIVEEGTEKSGVYLPVLFHAGGNYEIGDKITFEVNIDGMSSVTYSICGFYNNMMVGSYNCGTCAIIFSDDIFLSLEEQGFTMDVTLLSVRLKTAAQSKDFELTVKNAVSNDYPDIQALSNEYDNVVQSRYITQTICAGAISVVAVLVAVIALIMIADNVSNYIQENMRNFGTLKAIGYTSRQLMAALLIQFLGVGVIASVVGLGISYCIFPMLNSMLIAQTGIPYTIHFLIVPAMLTLAFIGGTVTLAVWFSARKIKKIDPILALRQGIQTHSFKRNRIPLEKTKAPLNIALSLKTTFSNIRQNITVCITMLLLSLLIVVSGVMFQNFLVDTTQAVNLIAGEIADTQIQVTAEKENTFLLAMESDNRVEKVYYFSYFELKHVDGMELVAMVVDDNTSKLNNQNLCYKGRLPKFDNEIALGGKYAKEQGLMIGDEVTLSVGGTEAKYIISGFTQIINSYGQDCLMLRSGYERLEAVPRIFYYVNLADNINVDSFNETINEQFGNDIRTINLQAALMGSMAVYIAIITLIAIVILILSIVVIAFVLFLLIRNLLNKKKRDYGILKSLGFTTKQLVVQTALSFMPITIVSTVVGVIVSAFVVNPLLTVFLSGMGTMRCMFTIPVGFIIIEGICMILFAFVFACLLSLRIRKIAPRSLLTNE